MNLRQFREITKDVSGDVEMVLSGSDHSYSERLYPSLRKAAFSSEYGYSEFYDIEYLSEGEEVVDVLYIGG